jgi:large subunit ribosomal protein L35
MPKVKTKKSITKRFRVTKKGKVLRRQGFTGHLNVKKSAKRKRKLKGVVSTKKVYADKIKKALGTRQ